MLFVLDDEVSTQGGVIGFEKLGLLERSGDKLTVTAPETGARFILLGGEPIGEPVIVYGPFAMNTQEDIVQAVNDSNAGTFGTLV